GRPPPAEPPGSSPLLRVVATAPSSAGATGASVTAPGVSAPGGRIQLAVAQLPAVGPPRPGSAQPDPSPPPPATPGLPGLCTLVAVSSATLASPRLMTIEPVGALERLLGGASPAGPAPALPGGLGRTAATALFSSPLLFAGASGAVLSAVRSGPGDGSDGLSVTGGVSTTGGVSAGGGVSTGGGVSATTGSTGAGVSA